MVMVTHWLCGTTWQPTPGQQHAPRAGGHGTGLALHETPGKNGLPAGQLAAETMMHPPAAVCTQHAPVVGQGLLVAVQVALGMYVPFIAAHSCLDVMMQELSTQHTPRHRSAVQAPLGKKMPMLVGQLAGETGATQLPLSRLQHAPAWPHTTPVHVEPAPNQGLDPHWLWVVIWHPAAAVQQAPVGKQVRLAHEVLAYQAPLQAFWTVWKHAAPGMQQAPVETQGLGEHDDPEYQALPAGHWDWGTFAAHPPVAALQQAPGVAGSVHGLGWQAALPPPRYIRAVPPHAEGEVRKHDPSATRQQAPI